MKYVVMAPESGAAHVCELCNGMERYCEVDAYWHHKSAYGIDDIFPKGKIGFDGVPKEGENILVVGAVLFYRKDMSFLCNYDNVKVIVPDGTVMRHNGMIQYMLKDYDVYTTNCKYQFFDYPVREYYQPFDFSWLDIRKNSSLTVSHGFWSRRKKREKGSDFIINMLKTKDVLTDIYSRLPWREAIRRKSRSHIYIDQIDHFDGHEFGWGGGIGKSGLEAMLLDCVVMCRGEFKKRELPVPPIAWCTKETISDLLDEYIRDDKKRQDKIDEQRAWAEIYLDKYYMARHVLRI